MAFNIVRKKKTVCLVSKGRDGESYLCSFGTMSDIDFKAFQQQVHDLPQEDRVEYCMRTKMMKEESDDTPRRKAPTGDIREQPQKKEKRVKKAKKQIEKEIIEVDDRPKKQSVILKKEMIAGMPLQKYKTISAKKTAITERVTDIESHITDQAIYLKHYKKRMSGMAKSEKQMRIDEASRYENYKIEGTKAIKILKKQRSELR